jgi:nucleoside-triphosphatase THEP1
MNSRSFLVAACGERSADKRVLIGGFIKRRRTEGLRVIGVAESPENGDACGPLALTDLATGARIIISQNLGSGSTACKLDPGGVALACAAVQSALLRGADLVVLSKFGKLEASGGGLCDAFGAAVECGVPVVTTLNPVLMENWTRFVGDLAEIVAPEPQALENWRRDRAAAARAA